MGTEQGSFPSLRKAGGRMKTENPMICGGAATLAAVALILWAADVGAYFQYTSAKGVPDQCALCHGDYQATPYKRLGVDQGWGTDLMSGHLSVITGCDSCHGSGPKYPVMTFSSAGTGGFNLSCLGCHGRFETPLGTLESSGLRPGPPSGPWHAGQPL